MSPDYRPCMSNQVQKKQTRLQQKELLKKLYSEMSAGFFSGSRKKLLPLLYKEPQPHTDKSVSNKILTANTSCFQQIIIIDKFYAVKLLNTAKTSLTDYPNQGFRIIKQNSENLASGHGFVVQNRAIMRYTLFVVQKLLHLPLTRQPQKECFCTTPRSLAPKLRKSFIMRKPWRKSIVLLNSS